VDIQTNLRKALEMKKGWWKNISKKETDKDRIKNY